MGSASLPAVSLTTLPPAGASLAIVNVTKRSPGSSAASGVGFYLSTEGYFHYTVVQIFFVESPYSQEKLTFRWMKGKKVKITTILSFLFFSFHELAHR